MMGAEEFIIRENEKGNQVLQYGRRYAAKKKYGGSGTIAAG